MKYLFIILFALLSLAFAWNDADPMLQKVNKIRSEGCYCGKDKMKPVGPLHWNDTLENSAYRYARHLRRHGIFGHHSIDGKDVGVRLDEFGYTWQYAGENLAEGQESFEEVLTDWIKSESHCKMLMNPNMRETGIAYFRGMWVEHFGKKLPEGKIRKEGSIRQEK